MLVFAHQKLVLFAIPKTGTTALSSALRPDASTIYANPPSLKHMNVSRYKRFVEPHLEIAGVTNLKTVAIVRHPISWLASWYKYRGRPFLNGKPQSTRDISFDTFVEAYIQTSDRPAFANVGSQSNFLTQKSDDVAVDHLFQYEQFPTAVAFLEQALDRKIKLKHENVSPDREFDLSADVETALMDAHPLDFAIWESAAR